MRAHKLCQTAVGESQKDYKTSDLNIHVNIYKYKYTLLHLAMNKCYNCQIPSSVSGHYKAKKRSNLIVVKEGYERSSGIAGSKYICPCSLVQMVIYIIDITVHITWKRKKKKGQIIENPFQICNILDQKQNSPCTSYKLNYRSKEKKSTIEG